MGFILCLALAGEMLAHVIWQGLAHCHAPKKDMLWLAFWSKEENEKCVV